MTKNFFLQRNWSIHDFEFGVLYEENQAGTLRVWYPKPLEMVEVTKEKQGIRMPALFSVRSDELQQLMDELWRVGLRPSEGTGSAGALAATQAHLKDLQTLTFKLLEQITKAPPPPEFRIVHPPERPIGK